LWCKRCRSSNQRPGSRHRSRGEHCIPNLGSGFVFDAKLTEFELTFSDPVHEFDAGDRRRSSRTPSALKRAIRAESVVASADAPSPMFQ
jgi:hypothetical protein